MLDILRKSYTTLPDYQKIPNGKLLELGRREVLTERRNTSTNYHQVIADELLFLGLYGEAAPELEVGRQSAASSQKTVSETKIEDQKPKTKDQPGDFNYTLAVFYKRGDMANRAVTYAEPLWKNVPADYEIELIPREQLELLYPDAVQRFAFEIRFAETG